VGQRLVKGGCNIPSDKSMLITIPCFNSVVRPVHFL